MPETPNGHVVLAFSNAALNAVDDPTDITEAVKFLYDAVIQSMDWGSGFLSHEEQHLVYDLGKALGFEPPGGMECMEEQIYFPDYGRFQHPPVSVPGYWSTRYTDKCRFEGIDDEGGDE